MVNELLRPKEVAQILNISPTTVHRLAAVGTLPSVWIGGQRRFRLEDIRQVVGNGTREPKRRGRPRKSLCSL